MSRSAPATYAFLLSASQFVRAAAPASPALAKLGERQYWVKEILRVGCWYNESFPAPGYWDVTPATLETIVRSFQLARDHGGKCPVVMAPAGVADQHAENASTKIGAVESLWVDGDCLKARLWTRHASNDAVYQLDVHEQDVSVYVCDWTLGDGTFCPLFLKHVAIVTHGVVGAQGPFIKQLTKLTARKRFQLTKGKTMAEDITTDDELDVAELLKLLGTILPQMAKATPEDFMMRLRILAEDAAPAGDVPVDDYASMAANPASASPAQLCKAVPALFQAVQAERKKLLERDRAAYAAKLDAHVARGAITAADAKAMIEIGAAGGYQLATADHLARIPDGVAWPANQKPEGRQLATAKPPEGQRGSEKMTPARAKELASRFRS